MASGKEWIYQTNIYEVNLRQYSHEGTFRAFMKHLPRLKDMGVETLWFMPVTPISQKNKKGSMGSYYACSDYTGINPEFGTLQDFKDLVYEAHQMGFKVILDWVANHTGWDHVWTTEHPDWYERDEHTGDFKKASGMDDIIELDFQNSDMRKAMIAAMEFWVRECKIDGYRCDLAFWVQLDFWVEAKAALDQVAALFWLAEADSIDSPDYLTVFDAAYTWAWMHKSEAYYKSRFPFTELKEVLDRYRHSPGIKAWFTSNHDENTWNGTEYEKYGSLARTMAVFSATWQGLPLVYSGQELPNWKRLAFFEKDPIDWNGQYLLHGFYKQLFDLRKQVAALDARVPVHEVNISPDQNILAYTREEGGHGILVILNFGDHPIPVYPKGAVSGGYRELFTQNWIDFSNVESIDMQPWEYRVFVKGAGFTVS